MLPLQLFGPPAPVEIPALQALKRFLTFLVDGSPSKRVFAEVTLLMGVMTRDLSSEAAETHPVHWGWLRRDRKVVLCYFH